MSKEKRKKKTSILNFLKEKEKLGILGAFWCLNYRFNVFIFFFGTYQSLDSNGQSRNAHLYIFFGSVSLKHAVRPFQQNPTHLTFCSVHGHSLPSNVCQSVTTENEAGFYMT